MRFVSRVLLGAAAALFVFAALGQQAPSFLTVPDVSPDAPYRTPLDSNGVAGQLRMQPAESFRS